MLTLNRNEKWGKTTSKRAGGNRKGEGTGSRRGKTSISPLQVQILRSVWIQVGSNLNFWPLLGQLYTHHWFQCQWGTSLVGWRQWWRAWWRRWGGRAAGGFPPSPNPPRSSQGLRLLRTWKLSSKGRKMQNLKKWRRIKSEKCRLIRTSGNSDAHYAIPEFDQEPPRVFLVISDYAPL